VSPDTLLSRWPGHEELVGSMITKMITADRNAFAVLVVVIIGAILGATAFMNTTLLGIHWEVMILALLPPVFMEWVAFHYCRKFGALHPRYFFWDRVQDACITACFAVLLVAQGTAFSPLWFIVAANIAAHARRPHSSYLEWFQGAAYALLIGYFLWMSRPVDASIVLLLGAVALWAIKAIRTMQMDLLDAEIRRVDTRRSLHEIRVDAERQRLSDAVESGLALEMEQMLNQIQSIPNPPENLKAMVAQTCEHFASLRSLVDTLRAHEMPEEPAQTDVEKSEIKAELDAMIRAEYEERIGRIRGPKDSWVRLMLDRIGGALVFGSGLALIYFSGSATSIFWFVIVAQLLTIHRAVFLGRFFLMLHAAGYVILVGAFLATGARGDAVITLVVGGTALWVLHASLKSHVNRLRISAESNILLREMEEAHVQSLRNRVARDLHDGVAADLVVLVMQGRSLQQTPQDLIQRMEIAALIVQAQAGLEELRNVVWGLSRDGLIRWNDLVPRLHRKASDLTRGMCELDFEADGEPETGLPLDAALSLIRVAQEAIRNAINYADPSRVGVRLDAKEKIVLEVWDDGPGFPPDLVATRGLKNLKDRASELGGTFEFWNQGGAHVLWSIPMTSKGAAES